MCVNFGRQNSGYEHKQGAKPANHWGNRGARIQPKKVNWNKVVKIGGFTVAGLAALETIHSLIGGFTDSKVGSYSIGRAIRNRVKKNEQLEPAKQEDDNAKGEMTSDQPKTAEQDDNTKDEQKNEGIFVESKKNSNINNEINIINKDIFLKNQEKIIHDHDKKMDKPSKSIDLNNNLNENLQGTTTLQNMSNNFNESSIKNEEFVDFRSEVISL